jgi:hypothetical protein
MKLVRRHGNELPLQLVDLSLLFRLRFKFRRSAAHRFSRVSRCCNGAASAAFGPPWAASDFCYYEC